MNELPNPYRYEKGVRVYLSGEEPIPESSYEFIDRMKSAEDVSWLDLNRAEDELPVFDECKKDRRCIRSALEGIAVGGKMLVVTSKAGFDSWSTFESLALRKCKAVKKLYLLAKEERKNRRLHGAEEALYERAVEGVDEPMVNHLGQIVGYRKKYSDKLLEVQLKALDPDKYSDKKDKTDKGLVINVEMGLRKKEIDKADYVEVQDIQFTGLSPNLRENNSKNKLDSASE
tara:strand:+ start:12147 stop:12836 length:690 start_codon:yes stop_codon:yes gene_type:complete